MSGIVCIFGFFFGFSLILYSELTGGCLPFGSFVLSLLIKKNGIDINDQLQENALIQLKKMSTKQREKARISTSPDQVNHFSLPTSKRKCLPNKINQLISIYQTWNSLVEEEKLT